MALFNKTLAELIKIIANLYLDDWYEGEATGGSTTTCADTSRPETDDYFNSTGSPEIYFESGNNATLRRRITDFASTGGVITFTPALPNSIVAGDFYSILTKYRRSQIVDAINQAMDIVVEEGLFWKLDEASVTVEEDTWEYDLPTSFIYVYRVTEADEDGTFQNDEIDPNAIEIIKGTNPKIRINPAFASLTVGRKLRIEGLSVPENLTSDTDACPINPAYICPQAAAILLMKDDTKKILSESYQKKADICRSNTVSMSLPMNSKRVIE